MTSGKFLTLSGLLIYWQYKGAHGQKRGKGHRSCVGGTESTLQEGRHGEWVSFGPQPGRGATGHMGRGQDGSEGTMSNREKVPTPSSPPPSSPVPSEGSGSLPHGRSLPCPPTAGPSPGRGFCLPVLSPFPPLSPPIILPRSTWPGHPCKTASVSFSPPLAHTAAQTLQYLLTTPKVRHNFLAEKEQVWGDFFF